MEYITLNNGVRMPMAGIGTVMLTPDEAEASVLSALKGGNQLIDTANAYVNEKAVGRAMRKSGVPLDRIFPGNQAVARALRADGRGGKYTGAPGHGLH